MSPNVLTQQAYRALAREVAQAQGVDVLGVLGRSRRAEFVRARRELWRRARSLVRSDLQLAKLAGVHHTTILYHRCIREAAAGDWLAAYWVQRKHLRSYRS